MAQGEIEYEQHLKVLLEHYFKTANHLQGKKIGGPNWFAFAEAIAKKVYSHITTVYQSYHGVGLRFTDNTKIEFVDYASMAVVTRAAIEAYLTFHFVFVEPQTDTEKEFRFDCWDLAGFIEREDFPATEEETRARLVTEQGLKKNKLSKIKISEIYQGLATKERRQIEKGSYKLGKSWSELAEIAGFDKKYFSHIYSYLCSYSHSGRLSILQIQQTKGFAEEKNVSKLYLAVCNVVLAKMLTDYVALIPETKDAFNQNPEAVMITEIWKGIGEGLREKPSF